MQTFDIHFYGTENAHRQGFTFTYDEAKEWIKTNKENGNFNTFKGGAVLIVCNQTGHVHYCETI